MKVTLLFLGANNRRPAAGKRRPNLRLGAIRKTAGSRIFIFSTPVCILLSLLMKTGPIATVLAVERPVGILSNLGRPALFLRPRNDNG